MSTSAVPDPMTAWTGRHDGDGPEHARWHQAVRAAAQVDARGEHIGLVGFRSDEGVRRNQGRVGAADGPAALRSALAPLALHGPFARARVGLVDHGDAVTVGEDLEAGQDQAAGLIARALDAEGARLVVVLGGGHETAWASYRGLMASRRMSCAGAPAAGGGGADGGAADAGGAGADGVAADGPTHPPRYGVLNLDAHFDLRREDRATSGTPFAQMADAEAQQGRTLRYAVLGVAEPANTGALFAEARGLGARWMTDLECAEAGARGIRNVIDVFASDLDVLHLSIDLDLLPASVAPGVSAPAGVGVSAHLVTAAVRAAAATGKLALVDVVELNPSLDIDSHTARTAARLIDETVHGICTGRT